MKTKKLNGIKKVAVLLITLGPEISSILMKNFSREEIEMVSSHIANTGVIERETKEHVLDEFLNYSDAQLYLSQGGIKYAREVLEKALGSSKASEIIKKIVDNSQVKPFSFMRSADPRQLVDFISSEHPQTIALILTYLDPEQASTVLNCLGEEIQTDIAQRIATMERTSPEMLREIEVALEGKLSSLLVGQDFHSGGGIQSLVDILNCVDRGTEKTILESLEQQDRELAEEIRKRMFVFEDITTLDDSSIRRLLREVDMKDLSLSLKGASDEVASIIYKNISKRAAEMLKEDIDILGPVRLRDVEQAQQRIVQAVRHLDETGEIILSRGGEDAIIK